MIKSSHELLYVEDFLSLTIVDLLAKETLAYHGHCSLESKVFVCEPRSNSENVSMNSLKYFEYLTYTYCGRKTARKGEEYD